MMAKEPEEGSNSAAPSKATGWMNRTGRNAVQVAASWPVGM